MTPLSVLPGGTFRLSALESLLLHDALYAVPQPQAHPLAAFVAVQRGAGVNVAGLFDLLDADLDDGPMIGALDLEWLEPIEPEREYRVRGRVESVTPKVGRALGPFDLAAIAYEIADADWTLVARVRSEYVIPRPERGPAPSPEPMAARPVAARPGEGPQLRVDAVSVEKMKLLALLLDDANPIHLALPTMDGPVINQGPANLAIIVNLVGTAFPGHRLSRLAVRFLATVPAGAAITAGVAPSEHGELRVWLDRDDGTRVIEGTARLTPVDAR